MKNSSRYINIMYRRRTSETEKQTGRGRGCGGGGGGSSGVSPSGAKAVAPGARGRSLPPSAAVPWWDGGLAACRRPRIYLGLCVQWSVAHVANDRHVICECECTDTNTCRLTGRGARRVERAGRAGRAGELAHLRQFLRLSARGCCPTGWS